MVNENKEVDITITVRSIPGDYLMKEEVTILKIKHGFI